MGNIKDFFEEDHKGEIDLAMCRVSELEEKIEDLEATIRNKDHIIAGLKKKYKRLKDKQDGGRKSDHRRL